MIDLIFHEPQTDRQRGAISQLLKGYWAYHGIYVGKVRTSYNTYYKFWDIHIDRGVLYKYGYGRGTISAQNKNWESVLNSIKQLHGVDLDIGWTWEAIRDDTYTDNQSTSNGNVSCPSARFWIYVEGRDEK